MRKPFMCGSNKVNMPESGCDDCTELAYRIDQLERWRDEFVDEGYNALANKPTINGVTVEGNKTSEDYLILPLSAEDIIDATPMECYVPPCADSRACYGEACCMIVGCNTSDSSFVCEGTVCDATVACNSGPLQVAIVFPASSDPDVASVNYSISNTSNAPITDISVVIDGYGLMMTIAELGAGESRDTTQLYVIKDADREAGNITFTATATGTQNGETVVGTKSATVELPSEDTCEDYGTPVWSGTGVAEESLQ